MKLTVTRIVCLLILALMLGLSALGYIYLPDQPIATHFNSAGEADGFMPRDTGLIFGPAVGLVIFLIFSVLPVIMPRKSDLARSPAAYSAIWIGVMAVMAVAHGAILAHAFGLELNTTRIIMITTGVLFILLGNVLPKTRYNYVMGVRTPWTLADERVWDRTHRLTGPLMMLGGAGIIAGTFLLPAQYIAMVVLVCSLVPAGIGFVYSYLVACKLKI